MAALLLASPAGRGFGLKFSRFTLYSLPALESLPLKSKNSAKGSLFFKAGYVMLNSEMNKEEVLQGKVKRPGGL